MSDSRVYERANSVQKPGQSVTTANQSTADSRVVHGTSSTPSWKVKKGMAIRVVVSYLVLGGLWILCSDWLLYRLVKNPDVAVFLATIKGWLFVGVTASLLAVELNRFLREIRRTTQQLEASEQRWQFALEGAGHGVWDWNAETNEVFYSAQWKAMLGFEPQEIGNPRRRNQGRQMAKNSPMLTSPNWG